MILIGMYALWMQRNRRKHGEQTPPIKDAVQWAVDLAFDLHQVWQSEAVPARMKVVPTWEKPSSGWFKCNTDGAFYDHQWKGATGAVLCDASGGFVRATAKWYDHCLDALTAEAMACRDGLLMAAHLGINRVWLETDCQEVVRLWQAGSKQRSSIGAILKEIDDLSTRFQGFKFSFVSRSCNEVAHILAKQVTGDTRMGWWSSTPACVSHLLTSFCNLALNQ
jgi:ribonuclease HI